jgi:Ser/Thr protein kinase RdoA (MazF antagonist)
MQPERDDSGPQAGPPAGAARASAGTGTSAGPAPEPFAGLSPDVLLNAVDEILGAPDFAAGQRTSGQVLTLNSYENRVFQVGLEAVAPPSAPAFAPADPPAPLIVKFYRPGRWSDAQILEEHAFLEELAQAEVPAVAALPVGGRTLHAVQGFRVALFERRGGRTPELSDPAVRERIGRFLGRLHMVGARSNFVVRQRLDADSFGREPSAYLLEHDWLPPGLVNNYRALVAQALAQIDTAFRLAAPLRLQRVHGDCHPGNLLWSEAGAEPGPYFVDFDDSTMAPAVQDLWMLLSGDRHEMAAQMRDVLRGYEVFAPFDRNQLLLIEPLRTLRLIHYAAWIARRWADPAFPVAFTWLPEPRYWEARVLELREQLAAMQEEPLEL